MRLRSLIIGLTGLGLAAFGATAPASAAGTVHVKAAAHLAPGLTPFGAPLAGDLSTPAGSVAYDVLNSDSCARWLTSSLRSICMAVGEYAAPGYVKGMYENSENGTWQMGNPFYGLSTVTILGAVSCATVSYGYPSCLTVGEHFTNPKRPALLVEAGNINGFGSVDGLNPKGAAWSYLTEVSCPSSSWCMMVGSAGQAASHGLALRWDGTSLRQLRIPAPAGARSSELASVSCPSDTSCLAVGNYTSAAGNWRPYSVLWTSGTWHVQKARTVPGHATTTFEGVSCSANASCVAVGISAKPGPAAFAEQYSAAGWTVLTTPRRATSGLDSVSCPQPAFCAASGFAGHHALIETWNGKRWTAPTLQRTKAPYTTDALVHVSCLSPTICAAVGDKHNPNSRYAYRTLAMNWNGTTWRIATTYNQ